MTDFQKYLDEVTRWQKVDKMKPSANLSLACEVASRGTNNESLRGALLEAAGRLKSQEASSSERVMNEICEDGSPQSKFTLYLLMEWGYLLNEEMAVTIGQKAQELF